MMWIKAGNVEAVKRIQKMGYSMRIATAALAVSLTVALGACTRHDRDAADRRAREAQAEREANSAAHKAGRAAYEIAQESKKAAKKAGQKIREASREMRDGWNDAKHEAHENGKK